MVEPVVLYLETTETMGPVHPTSGFSRSLSFTMAVLPGHATTDFGWGGVSTDCRKLQTV